MLFLIIVTKTLHSATMSVVRNNVIRRHCCDRMRNWSGRRGVAGARRRVCGGGADGDGDI